MVRFFFFNRPIRKCFGTMDTSSTKTMIRDWRDFQNVNNSPLFISVDLELSLYRLLERDEYTKKKETIYIPCHSLFASFLRPSNQFYICTVRLRHDSSLLSDIQIHTYLHNYTKRKRKTKNENYIFETVSGKSNFPVYCVINCFIRRCFPLI